MLYYVSTFFSLFLAPLGLGNANLQREEEDGSEKGIVEQLISFFVTTLCFNLRRYEESHTPIIILEVNGGGGSVDGPLPLGLCSGSVVDHSEKSGFLGFEG